MSKGRLHEVRYASVQNDRETLDAIRSIFGLSESEIANLFNVQRQSIVRWRKKGIPDARQSSVAKILQVARLLHHELRSERIAEIVRTQDSWLEHGTILETLRHDDVDTVSKYLRRLFSYSS